MKRYLLVRWKKRWLAALIAGIAGAGCVGRSFALHDGGARGCVLLFLGLAIVIVLFPFHWAGERGWDEKEWDE
jgi:hypothetical protein